MHIACFKELRHDFAAAAREVREGVVANVCVARFGSVSDFYSCVPMRWVDGWRFWEGPAEVYA